MLKKFKNMKKTLMILMAVALVALPTMAQKNWGTQRPVYGSQYRPQQATMPTATYHPSTFHSTGSTMMRTGSMYSARPMLNTSGSAVYGGSPRKSSSKGSSGPHRGLINWGTGDDSGGGITGGGGYGDDDPIIVDGGGGGGGGGGLVTPDWGDDDDRPNGSPIGDAMLPLMLLACAYMCLRAFLKRKRATQS